MDRTKGINRRLGSSYGLKHITEAWSESYIPNGMFIAAAVHLGFMVERAESGPNAYLNVSTKSLGKISATLIAT